MGGLGTFWKTLCQSVIFTQNWYNLIRMNLQQTDDNQTRVKRCVKKFLIAGKT